MNPALLHARAAIASLQVAMRWLADEVRYEAESAPIGDDLGTLQAWRPLPLLVSGGRSEPADPIGDAVLAHATLDRTGGPAAHRYRETTSTLAWLAARVLGDQHVVGHPPLDQLARAVPGMGERTAVEVAEWVTEHDQMARRAAGLGADELLMAGALCPACGLAGCLTLRAASQLITCTACRGIWEHEAAAA